MAGTSSCFMCLPSITLTKCESSHQRLFGRLLSSKPSIPYLKCGAQKSLKQTPKPFDATTESSNHSPVDLKFHPNLWDNHFTGSISESLEPETFCRRRIKELKKDVKSMLALVVNDPFKEMDLVDKIQRLGLGYHFEEEIEDILQRIYDDHSNLFFEKAIEDSDLHTTALQFRLLRQAGYYVSPDVFNKFKDGKGEFCTSLMADLQGMLSLYEASYLGFNGEDLLNEAMAFTTKHLKSMVPYLNPSLASQIQHALEIPVQNSCERLQARHYISIYQEDKSRNESLLEFAKLDFNMVLSVYHKEMSEVKRWWEDLNIKAKLPFEIRDRVVEGYAMTMLIYHEPQYSLGRIQMAKLYAMISVLDDAHDVYGDLEELGPLAKAFQRWDVGDDDLKEHMKVIFLEMLNVVNEIGEEMIKRGQFNAIPYLKQEIKDYTRDLLVEAKLIYSGHFPTVEEWLPISAATGALSIFIVDAVMNMGDIATKEIFDWIASDPKIMNCSYYICRLLGDVGTFKVEQERGVFLSNVTCYMKEHGVSESKAIECIQQKAMTIWKDMNQECLRPNPVPRQVLRMAYNLSRIMLVYYSDGDGYTHSKGHTQEIIASLLINPIPI